MCLSAYRFRSILLSKAPRSMSDVCTVCFPQHSVLVLPDGAAECVCSLPVWGGQRPPVSGTGFLVRHCDGWQHTAVQVYWQTDEKLQWCHGWIILHIYVRFRKKICMIVYKNNIISIISSNTLFRILCWCWTDKMSHQKVFLISSCMFVFSCAESQSVPLYLDVDTSSFYTELSLAQVGTNCSILLSRLFVQIASRFIHIKRRPALVSVLIYWYKYRSVL